MDAALGINEVVEDVRRRRGQGLAFELDFEKAYDRVSWGNTKGKFVCYCE